MKCALATVPAKHFVICICRTDILHMSHVGVLCVYTSVPCVGAWDDDQIINVVLTLPPQSKPTHFVARRPQLTHQVQYDSAK